MDCPMQDLCLSLLVLPFHDREDYLVYQEVYRVHHYFLEPGAHPGKYPLKYLESTLCIRGSFLEDFLVVSDCCSTTLTRILLEKDGDGRAAGCGYP